MEIIQQKIIKTYYVPNDLGWTFFGKAFLLNLKKRNEIDLTIINLIKIIIYNHSTQHIKFKPIL